MRELTNRIWALYPQRPPYRGAFENVIPTSRWHSTMTTPCSMASRRR